MWCSFRFRAGERLLTFELVLTLGVILYIILLYIIYYTIIYYILYIYIYIYIYIYYYILYYPLPSSVLLLLSSHLPNIPLPLPSLLPLLSLLFLPNIPLIQSIRVGVYCWILISQTHLPIRQSDPACFIGVDG